MDTTCSLKDNLDRFLRLTRELERSNEKIKDQAIILLNSLPRQFDHFKDVIEYINRIDEIIQRKNYMYEFYNRLGG